MKNYAFLPESEDGAHMMEPYEISLVIREAERCWKDPVYIVRKRPESAPMRYTLASFREVFLCLPASSVPDPALPSRDLDPPLSFLCAIVDRDPFVYGGLDFDSRVQAAIFAVRGFQHEMALEPRNRDVLRRLRALP